MSPTSSRRFFLADHYPHSAVLTPFLLALCTPLLCDLFPEITSHFFFFFPLFPSSSSLLAQIKAGAAASPVAFPKSLEMRSYPNTPQEWNNSMLLYHFPHEVLVDLKAPLPTGDERPGVWEVPFIHPPPHADSHEGWSTSKSSAPSSLLNFRRKVPFAGIF